MGVAAGPKVVSEGLVFSFDARNLKTYDEIPGITDHGISDWYCFTSGTATYSAIYPNTEIIEIDADGNETVVVTTGSNPERGTDLTITAGKRYYGTKAIHILDEGVNDAIAPVSFAGTYFGNRHTRNDPKTMNIYAPQDDINVSVYEDVTGGVTGTATSTFSVSRGSSATFVTTQGINVNTIFKTDKPAIMTVGSGADDNIMQPMANYVYKRRNANSITINNTTAANTGTYVSHDTSGSNLPLFTLEIADGAGGDSTQGIGYEYLSDTFSWGNVLSDYQIVAPYADTTVTVSYWTNNQWNVGEIHSLSGTQTNPAAAFRDGTNGFGVNGTNISGQAANLASGANLWKWESTKPIAVIINDIADDEENLLGWMSNKYLRTSSNVTQSFVNLIDKDDRSRMKMYGKDLTTTVEYAGAKLSGADYIEFDGVNDYISVSLNNPGGDWIHSIEFWMYMNQNQSAISSRQDPFQIGTPGTSQYSAVDISNNNFNWYFYSNDCRVTTNLFVANTWYYIGLTYTGGGATSTNKQLYVNGINVPFNTSGSANLNIPANSTLSIGRDGGRTTAYFNGRISNFKIYNKALTPQEIQQNFNATRGRFDI